ncbi:lytic transglycosylase domain-containing protein [Microbacter margulisiae]|uniref:Membrane-bound lytic murein transglycosylase D n=1 Tax=Microbacter margulisiae TaxID=1350067 RepID=A0A7W5DPU5_9PORP|nr:lytic transglycosylase domain-containing protein [Microbacter margulisiae]MBB3186772.1 membrane-bound lytic murein transglycosylase D [Microbacter margulisiae]
MRRFLPLMIFVLMIVPGNNLRAQLPNDVKPIADTSQNTDPASPMVPLVIPEGMDMSFDGLLNQWYAKKNIPSIAPSDTINPYVSDSTIISRLSRLPDIIEMPFNEYVRTCINFYTNKRRKQVSYMLALAKYYMPLFEQVILANKLPDELKYLPIIESALNPTAYSRAGAAGLWQLVVSTARIYGLQVNSLIDERMDPVKSTKAAVHYLKDLYHIYGDWDLVIAAYNCGPGTINKAIRRSGGKHDYWQIYPYLPMETRSYVPIFIAANYVMNYYKDCNLSIAPIYMPLSDTVMVHDKIHFIQLSDLLHIPIEELRTLNPEYRQDIVPGNIEPCPLRLPLEATSIFLANESKIAAYKADELFPNRLVVEPVKAKSAYRHRRIHRVRNGESLWEIARRYHVTTRELKRWNHLRTKTLRKGTRLVIY